jgi:hypothetical protein
MAVKKLTSGEWLCDFRVDGRESRRVRKRFGTKGEAVAYEQYFRDEAANKPWMSDKEDRRKLSELIMLWHNLHGQALVASKSRLAKLHIICNGLGDPVASQLTAKDWAHYRDRRLRGEIDNGYHKDPAKWVAKPITVNREHHYLEAVFNELKRLGSGVYPTRSKGCECSKKLKRKCHGSRLNKSPSS